MQSFIIETMNQFGYLGIALLIMIENIFPPIPSEVILAFGGFMTTYSSMNIIGVTIYASIGSMLGAIILYGVGHLIKPSQLETLLDSKIAHMLRFKKEDVTNAVKWFEKRGNATVFFCRFIPIVRSLISLPAGIAKMNFSIFFLLSALGSIIWNTVLVCAGAAAGENWELIVSYISQYSHYAFYAFILLALAFVVFRFTRKKKV